MPRPVAHLANLDLNLLVALRELPRASASDTDPDRIALAVAGRL